MPYQSRDRIPAKNLLLRVDVDSKAHFRRPVLKINVNDYRCVFSTVSPHKSLYTLQGIDTRVSDMFSWYYDTCLWQNAGGLNQGISSLRLKLPTGKVFRGPNGKQIFLVDTPTLYVRSPLKLSPPKFHQLKPVTGTVCSRLLSLQYLFARFTAMEV